MRFDWEAFFWFMALVVVCATISIIGFEIWKYQQGLLDDRVEICKIAIQNGKEVLCWDNLAN